MYEYLLLLLLIGGLIIFIVVNRRQSKMSREYVLAQFDSWLDTWLAQGRIAPDVAAALRRLIAEERGSAPAPVQQNIALPPPPPPPLPVKATTGAEGRERPISSPVPTLGTSVASMASVPSVAQNTAIPPAPIPASTSAASVASVPQNGDRFWQALLALNTRRTLLVLGAFLLVMSGLTLVVFNWNSFPPLVQIALLVGVTGGLWGAGAWMARNPDLRQAGVNLQAVAALLVPVVGFALSRPGLLDLAPRTAAALAAGLSLIAYLLATALTRRLFYSVAAAVAGLILVLAAPVGLAHEWLPPLAATLLLGYLVLSWRLDPIAPKLARGPRWVAHLVMPGLVLICLALVAVDMASSGSAALTLWLAVAFYALAAPLATRPVILFASLFLAPLASVATLDAVLIGWPWQPVALAGLGFVYLALAGWLEPRTLAYARPLYQGSALLALFSACFALDAEAGRIVVPVVLGTALWAAFLHRQGRTLALSQAARQLLLPTLLGFGGVLLPIWLVQLADLLPLTDGQIGLGFLVLGAVYFIAARWWPGQLRQSYDRVLQVEGALITAMAWLITLPESGLHIQGAWLALAIWTGQALLRRRWWWAIAALGTAQVAAALMIWRWWNTSNSDPWMLTALCFAAVYAIGGSLLRRTPLRYWTWPALGWAAVASGWALLFITIDVTAVPVVRPMQVVVLFGLALTVAVLSWLWRRPWAGAGAAALLSAGVLLAGLEGFFLGLAFTSFDIVYVLSGLCFGLFGLGQIIRRAAKAYAHPYELTAFVLISGAPLLAAASSSHQTLAWAAMSLLYGLGLWRYRIGWLLAPALVAFDLALLNGAVWLFPNGRSGSLGMLLLAAIWVQGLGLLLSKKLYQPGGQSSIVSRPWSIAGYLALTIGGAMAIFFALPTEPTAAGVLLGLALLAGLIAQVERREEAAWLAFVMLLGGLNFVHTALALSYAWSLAWFVVEMLGVVLVGWAVQFIAGRTSAGPSVALWKRVTTIGPFATSGIVILALGALVPGGTLLPLTFALATFALLLATLAVRERSFPYAYGAGASVVAAALCQLAEWGFSEPQWYVIPAGLYMLGLAECMRRFQGQRRVSRVIEAAAMVILVGTTLAQALGAGGGGYGYDLLLFIEGLIFVGYGTLLRLRVPFLGGVAFFVAGALSLSIETMPLINPWVIFGGLGLLMVVAYVLLERRAEQLTRLGKNIMATLEGWG